MLLVDLLDGAIRALFGLMVVGNAIFQQEQQPLWAAHRSKDPVGWGVDIQIGLVFWRRMNNLIVEISQDSLLNLRVDITIRIVLVEWGNRLIQGIFLPETVERGFCLRSCAIERALNGHNPTHCVILHVVGEDHQLRDVDEATKLFVGEALMIHAIRFRNHAAHVVRLLHFDEDKGKAIDKQRDVRSEFVLIALAGEFRSAVIGVVLWMVIIHQFDRRDSLQPLIEALANIVIIQFLPNRAEHGISFACLFRIQPRKLLLEHINQNVRVRIINRTCFVFCNFAKVGVAYARQMNKSRHLNPCCLVPLRSICRHGHSPFCRMKGRQEAINPSVLPLHAQ